MKTLFKHIVAACLFAFSAHVIAAGLETTPTANDGDADFVAGKAAIDAKNWDNAIKHFKRVVSRDAKNADAHNYLGYAYRWTNKMDDSFKHYDTALSLDPNHKGAHEYIGQAYLKVNKLDKAKEHLAKLEKICGMKCEEYEDLAKAIAAYKPKG